MIYELRTYTFNPGKLPAYIEHVEKVGRPVRGDDYGKCWGYWTSEFGQINQAWHLWSYASFDERTRMREMTKRRMMAAVRTVCSRPAWTCRQREYPKPWSTSYRRAAGAGPGSNDQNSPLAASRR